MKARKIHLKRFPQTDPFTHEEIRENGKTVDFSYRQQLWVVLRTPNNGQALSTEGMMKRAQVQFLLEHAEDNKDLLLDEAQYTVLKDALEHFQWPNASSVLVEMIADVKDAEEVELEPKKEKN